MKQLFAMCAVLAMASGAYGVTLNTWAGAADGAYTTTTNWDTAVVPNTNADNVVDTTTRMRLATSGSYTIGELWITGAGALRNGANSTATYTVDNSNGCSGSVIRVGSYANADGATMTWNVYGDWRLGGGSAELGYKTLNLYGKSNFVQKGSQTASTALNGLFGAATDGYVIDTNIYGSYANDANSRTDIRTWRFENLKVKSTGAINGGFWVVKTLQVEAGGQLIENPANHTDFVFFGRSNVAAALQDNTNLSTGYAGGRLALPGGVVLPRNVELSTAFSFNSALNPLYVWKMASSAQSINVGDLYVNGNLILGRNIGGVNPGVGTSNYIAAFNPVDNDVTGTPRNAYIRGNLTLSTSASHRGILYIDDTNTSSVIDVGGTVYVGTIGGAGNRTNGAPGGSVHLGGGTVKVGGDWYVSRGDTTRATNSFLYTNWDEGTSTVIFDGNGTVKTQTLYTDDMPLHNVVIHTPVGGTVTMSTGTSNIWRDFLTIRGDLRLEQGTFNDRDRAITFNGPDHTLFWDNNTAKVTGNSLDNIILLPDAVLTLNADTSTTIVMDNIDMQLGSKLYLNTFTLKVDGQTFVSSDYDSIVGIAHDQGTIYGTLSNEIPEPGTLLLIGTGALGVIGYIRRRRMA